MIMCVEACITTIYVQNRSPHQFLKYITPEEALTGVKPDTSGYLGAQYIFMYPKRRDPS
jgi:hypothetical protein